MSEETPLADLVARKREEEERAIKDWLDAAVARWLPPADEEGS